MFELLKRILGAGRSERELTDRVLRLARQMQADLSAELPLADLRPVLIPSSIFADGNWFGPHHFFEKLPLSLTWAYVRPEHTLQYVSAGRAEKLAADGIDWRGAARAALFADSEARPWTFKRSPGGDSAAAAVLQDDLGASRLLCLGQLDAMFPKGFSFFVPNRDCVLVLADDAPPEVREQTAAMVRQLHGRADVPMSLEPFDHRLLKEALAEAGEFA